MSAQGILHWVVAAFCYNWYLVLQHTSVIRQQRLQVNLLVILLLFFFHKMIVLNLDMDFCSWPLEKSTCITLVQNVQKQT